MKTLLHSSQTKDSEEPVLKPGLIILERYSLVKELGKGGMGVVWKAIDLILEAEKVRQKYVAIKFLNQEFKQPSDAGKTLVHEFTRYNKLTNPNIVKARSIERFGSSYFMVMEFLEGKPLNEIIENIKKERENLSFAKAEQIIKNMCHALTHVHQQGFAHLDFKPANVIYDPKENIAKVIDFGISRWLEQSKRDETNSDPGNFGPLTERYASREMLLGMPPDPRDDIYGLACVTYGLLSGEHPFNVKATTAEENNLSPKDIKGLKRIQNKALKRGLAFKRDKRTPTATQFFNELFPKKNKNHYFWGLIGGSVLALAIVAGFVWDQSKDLCGAEPAHWCCNVYNFSWCEKPPPLTVTQLAHCLFDSKNLANFKIEILPSTALTVGENIKIRLNSDYEGYLLILHIDINRSVLKQLFPRQDCQTESYIKAEQTVIPALFDECPFRIEEPVGKEALIAILTKDKFKFSFEMEMEPAKTSLRRLRHALDETVQNDLFQWFSVVVEYETFSSTDLVTDVTHPNSHRQP